MPAQTRSRHGPFPRSPEPRADPPPHGPSRNRADRRQLHRTRNGRWRTADPGCRKAARCATRGRRTAASYARPVAARARRVQPSPHGSLGSGQRAPCQLAAVDRREIRRADAADAGDFRRGYRPAHRDMAQSAGRARHWRVPGHPHPHRSLGARCLHVADRARRGAGALHRRLPAPTDARPRWSKA